MLSTLPCLLSWPAALECILLNSQIVLCPVHGLPCGFCTYRFSRYKHQHGRPCTGHKAICKFSSIHSRCRKLSDVLITIECMQASHPGGEKGTMSSKLLNEMAQFVDEALRDAPASCNNQAANDAALGSVSNTKDSNSHADVQPSADAYKAETDMPFQQAPNVASTQAQDSKEQAPKCLDRLGSSASVRSISSKIVNKPAWAMTADAAQAAEQQEEEDLLAFAGGLEFDKYINQQEDAELRTVLQVNACG